MRAIQTTVSHFTMKKTAPNRETIAARAARFGVSARRLHQLKKAGVDIFNDPELAACLTPKAEGNSDAERLLHARMIRAEHAAAREKLKLDLEARGVVSRAVVEAEAARLGVVLRSLLLKLPSDLPPRLEGCNATEIHKVLFAEVCEILETIHSGFAAI